MTKISKSLVEIRISVKDTGIGMNELDVKNLFSSYFKSSDPVSKLMNTRSNGIGLNLCKRIMRGLQGDLEVISKYGKGSTFTLSLKTDVAD